ncbi:MAG: pyruvate dehydrogenase (acetyl-transferring), homodimeric type [Nevskiaceae bacterium]|nr:MAG: pyruvate dehydrogenase (acetyl-transferring), homodimeric type [Nevskiaceae bacterium]TBR73919.1 MAG: pyruvate dehydrogenase (acetyl-transferring), homodimeric type [Nevskiaceae bacterium]
MNIHETPTAPVLDEDPNPEETREWVESLEAVIRAEGPKRAGQLVEQLADETRRAGGQVPFAVTTDYINTIPVEQQVASPGDAAIEWRIRCIIRWNAMAMVVRQNRRPGKLGGHIASFGSSATLYEVGFNHFWRAASAEHPGDLVFYQGHSSPGLYSRSFLEGRLTAEQLDHYRRDASSAPGLSLTSYPHPWLMPDYWKVPTVSMGLGPIQAIYQAQFFKYSEARSLAPQTDRKVWCFLGDGECDEPESLGAISAAGRERLDNLVFVINCNLQRLDGPVRGNGKIIQELEGVFRGAGWNVIKVIWGSRWDPLLANDTEGVLKKLMMETVDGEYQACKAFGGAYTREHFFNKHPETAAMVANISDDDVWRLNRGGHDPHKVYAAYYNAVHTRGKPTVILAKTVKGYGMGAAGESMNIAHQAKKMHHEAILAFRDRFQIPLPDKQLEGDGPDAVPYYHPGKDSKEVQYLLERRAALGGTLPHRRRRATHSLKVPELEAFEAITKGTNGREISNTMALVRGMNLLLRDPEVAPRVVPIVVDEARTFGMEGMFRKIGIYAPDGQKYQPQDADQLTYYHEAADGQVLQEGISEAAGVSAWIAAGTSYSVSDQPMLPFFIYYSYFGFRRVGDLIWAAGDQHTRGFLIGATAGASFPGEGLQHSDTNSHLMAATIPNCRAYDPTFSYEVAVILQHGTRAMLEDHEDVFYYLTTTNENYDHPDMPAGCEADILKGMYLCHAATGTGPRVQLLGAGGSLRSALKAAELLEAEFGVQADVWSCTSFNELARDGYDCERYNRLHPAERRTPYFTVCLEGHDGPVVATTEYVRAVAEQIHAFVPRERVFTVLGADGYGRSDTREALRAFFEIDEYWIAQAAVAALAEQGALQEQDVVRAIALWQLDADKANPMHV